MLQRLPMMADDALRRGFYDDSLATSSFAGDGAGRAEELVEMRRNFYGFDPSCHVARYHFVPAWHLRGGRATLPAIVILTGKFRHDWSSDNALKHLQPIFRV